MARQVDVTIKGKDESKAAFDSAHANAESFGAKLKDTLNKPFELLKGLLAVEMVKVVGEFFKSTVEAAAESEAAWARVAAAVDNAGISFGGVRDELKDTFAAISDKTRFSEQEISGAFATVLNVSNDYKGSLANLGLITNIAIARQMDLSSAATLVGRVMDGNTSMLKRYGIVLKDNGIDPMQQLSERFAGFADKDGLSLQGRLHAIANEWEELKIQIGEAITGADGATTSANLLVDALHKIGTWVEDNREGIHAFVNDIAQLATVFASVASAAGKFFGNLQQHAAMGGPGKIRENIHAMFDLPTWTRPAWMGGAEKAPAPTVTFQTLGDGDPVIAAQKAANAAAVAAEKAKRDAEAADKALKKRIEDLKLEGDLLIKSRDVVGLTDKDYQKIVAAEMDLLLTSRDTTKSLGEREAAQQALNRLKEAEKKVTDEILKGDKELEELEKKGISLSTLRAAGAHQIGENQITVRATAAPLPSTAAREMSSRERIGLSMQEMMTGFEALDTSITGVGERLQGVAAGALTDFFNTWQGGIAAVIDGHEKMGVVIPRVLRRAVGSALAADATDTMLRAAKAFALGLSDPSGIHFAQAAKLFAIGTAESAAAAALMGGGGASAGSGGGVSSGGFQSQQGSTATAGKVTVVLKGNGISFNNPDELNALRDAIQSLSGTRDLEFLFTGNS